MFTQSRSRPIFDEEESKGSDNELSQVEVSNAFHVQPRYICTNLITEANITLADVEVREVDAYVVKDLEDYFTSKNDSLFYQTRILDPVEVYKEELYKGNQETLVPYDEIKDLCVMAQGLYEHQAPQEIPEPVAPGPATGPYFRKVIEKLQADH